MEDFADEQGFLIQVSENSDWDNIQRMFPFQAVGSGRVLRVQVTPDANPLVELRLSKAAEEEKYDGLVCGMLWHWEQGVGTAFPLTPVYRQKAVWMTCQPCCRSQIRKLLIPLFPSCIAEGGSDCIGR